MADFTLADLRTELASRGFDYLPVSRLNSFLNRAYGDVCGQENWPFLLTTASGTTPLSIDDVRTIGSVIDTTSQVKLQPVDVREIGDDWDTSLTTAGQPWGYYLSDNTLNVYPTSSTDSFTVSYWKVPDDLVNDTDEPLIPNRFRLGAIVDGAAAFAYLDSDNFSAAQQMLSMWEGTVEMMREQLLNRDNDRPGEFVVVTDWSVW